MGRKWRPSSLVICYALLCIGGNKCQSRLSYWSFCDFHDVCKFLPVTDGTRTVLSAAHNYNLAHPWLTFMITFSSLFNTTLPLQLKLTLCFQKHSILLEQLIITKLVKKFPVIYGTCIHYLVHKSSLLDINQIHLNPFIQMVEHGFIIMLKFYALYAKNACWIKETDFKETLQIQPETHNKI